MGVSEGRISENGEGGSEKEGEKDTGKRPTFIAEVFEIENTPPGGGRGGFSMTWSHHVAFLKKFNITQSSRIGTLAQGALDSAVECIEIHERRRFGEVESSPWGA